MKCPIDQTDLLMTERQGVEIDYCPQCRGVWLDRGELDKILERSAQSPSQDQPDNRPSPTKEQESSKHHDFDPKKHKKRDFLGDLFGF
ncbi:MAG: hypothetical protein JWL85_550 [Candidatus Saccharibacteria bacterium]|nr:hypothetical protein [Candidatus Saccharibacteria bacterium]